MKTNKLIRSCILAAACLASCATFTPAARAETTWTASMDANGSVYAITVYLNEEGDGVSADIYDFCLANGVEFFLECGSGLIVENVDGWMRAVRG